MLLLYVTLIFFFFVIFLGRFFLCWCPWFSNVHARIDLYFYFFPIVCSISFLLCPLPSFPYSLSFFFIFLFLSISLSLFLFLFFSFCSLLKKDDNNDSEVLQGLKEGGKGEGEEEEGEGEEAKEEVLVEEVDVTGGQVFCVPILVTGLVLLVVV